MTETRVIRLPTKQRPEARRSRAERLAARILEAIGAIDADLACCGPERFGADRRLRRAVERNLSAIAEASRALPEAARCREPALGACLVAGAGAVAADQLWAACRDELGPLKRAAETVAGKIS